MPKVWLIAVLAVVTVLVGIFAFGWAQGTPAAPVAFTTQTITPTTAQSVPITFQFQVYSLQSPNSIWMEGQHVIFTAWQTASNGGQTTLAQNLTLSTSVVSSAGTLYTLQATTSVSTSSICSSPCTGIVENITLLAHAQVTTPFAVLNSPTVKLVLSSSSAYTTSSTVLPSPSPEGMYFQVAFPLTLIAAIDCFGAYAILMRHPAWVWTGALLVVAAVLEFFLPLGAL